MRRILIAVSALFLVAFGAFLLALRSETLVLSTTERAISTFTSLRLEWRNPRIDVYRGKLSADEFHLIPQGSDGPALVSILDLDVNTKPGDLLTANLLHSSLHASQLLIYVSGSNQATDPAPMRWVQYLGWLPEELRITKAHVISARTNTRVLPLKKLRGDRLERKHYQATADADYDGEPLAVVLDLFALTRDGEIRGADMNLVFNASETGSVVALNGKLEGTSSDFRYDFTLNANYTDISEFMKGFTAERDISGALQVQGRMIGDSEGFVLSDASFLLDNTPAYGFEAGGSLEYDRSGESRIDLLAAGELASLEYLIDWMDLDIGDLGAAQSSIKLSGSLDQPVIERFRVNTRNEEGLTMSIVGQLDFSKVTPGTVLPESNSVDIDIQGPSLASLGHWLKPPAYEIGPWRASGRVTGNRHEIALSDLVFEIGKENALELRATGQVGSIKKSGHAAPVPGTSAEYAIENIDLAIEAQLPDSAELAQITAIGFPARHQLTARFRLQGDEHKLAVSEGSLSITGSDLQASISPITAVLNPGAEYPLTATAADIAATLSDTSALSQYTDLQAPSLGPLHVSAKLRQQDQLFQIHDIVASVMQGKTNFKAQGSIGDAVNFSDVVLSGQFSGVDTRDLLTAWLSHFKFQNSVGTLAGAFKLSNPHGHWQLTDLAVQNTAPKDLLHIAVEGEISDLLGLPKANLGARFSASNRQLVNALVGMPMQPVKANLILKTVEGQVDGALTAQIGKTQLRAGSTVHHKDQAVESVKLQLDVPHFYLGDLGFPYSQTKAPAQNNAGPQAARETEDNDKVQSLIARLPRYPVDITVTVNGISGDNTAIDSLDAHITGSDNRYTLDHFSVVYDDALAEIRGNIDLNAEPPALSLSGHVDAIPINSLARDLGVNTDISGALTALGGITVRGTNKQQWLQSLNGNLAFALEKLVIKGAAYDLLATDLLAWIYSGARTEKSTYIDCSMARFELSNGIATTDSLYIESSKMVATGEGTFDLVQQTLDLTIIPLSKSRKLQVPSKVRLKGDLSKPKAVISPVAEFADASASALMLIPQLTMKLFGGNSGAKNSPKPCQAEAAN